MNERVILWRISNYATLDGLGGMYVAGRWHSKGRPVLYCSEDPSTALLETLVHLEIDAEDRPERFQVLKIESSEPVSIEQAEIGKADDWFEDVVWTRRTGDAWLSSARTLLLQVPSVLVPERRNYVVNPLHPEIQKLSITARYSHPFDPRFFR